LIAGIGLIGVPMARGEVSLPIDICVKLAEQKEALDKGDIHQLLAMKPELVLVQHGKLVVEKVRTYIALSEKVLFQCPPNVLNGTARSLASDDDELPPLPGKGPRRAKVELPRGTLVPLPTKRGGRSFRIPASPG
jgi:hypothetical protein